MAAAAETYRPTAAHTALAGRRSNTYDSALAASYTTTTSSPKKKLRLITSPSSSSSSSKPRAFGDVYSAGASPASSTTYFPPRRDSRMAGSKMSSSHIATIPAGGRSETRHAKLHKRGGSATSLPGSSLPSSGALPQIPQHDESSAPAPTTSTGSIPKIRPYLRKMSTKDDTEQGRLDLSKSISENPSLSGLGIQDLGQRSVPDVSFPHAAKRSHARNTSGDSQLSTASGSLRPTPKAFVHPMRQTPRPYTPPHGHSFDSSTMLNDEERNESDDVLTDDDFRLGHGFRSRRSVSISSTPVIAPTPLSQSHTAFDLGIVPKITDHPNASTTNLSIKSNKSGKSSKSRPSLGDGRSRRNTERSFETPTSTSISARTSLDKAFAFASGPRKSDTDPLTRDQRIQAARRKFEEREGKKDRKAEERVLKRQETDEIKQERQRRKSEASERTKISKKSFSTEKSRPAKGRGVDGRSYEDARPSHSAGSMLPRSGSGKEAGWSEKAAARKGRETEPRGGSGWSRFSVWMKMRVLSCGGKG